MPTSKKQLSESEPAFKVADGTKKVDLVEGDASKMVTIGAHLDDK